MTTSIDIRNIKQDDFDQWLPLWESYNEFYGRVGNTALPMEIIKSTWKRFFDDSEPVFGVIAEDNGDIVGLAHYIFHRNTIQIEPTCYLQDLFTIPTSRGQGVARHLISGLLEKVGKQGIKSVYWHTHSENKAAIRLYDKMATNTAFTVYRTST